MIKKVFMGQPWKFSQDFQKYLLYEHSCSIGNNVPHLDGSATALWWRAALGYHWNIYILPIQNYMESWSKREQTHKSFVEHGKPLNVLLYPTEIFDEPGTRSDKDVDGYHLAQIEYARALALGEHPFITQPFPVPGILRKDWIVPRHGGWRLIYLEDPDLLKKYRGELEQVVEKCCYLIDSDLANEDFDYEGVGRRIRIVGDNWPDQPLPWFLLNDLSELTKFFRKNSAGIYDSLTENGVAFMRGCL